MVLRVQRVRFLLGHGVAEPKMKLLRRLGDGFLVVEGIAQDWERALELGERERQHAADLRRIERHRGRRQPHAQQFLRDQSAEGMADHNRLRRQRPNDLGIVLDDVVDADVREPLGMGVRFRDRGWLAWPAGRDGVIAGGAEQLHPWFPGVRV